MNEETNIAENEESTPYEYEIIHITSREGFLRMLKDNKHADEVAFDYETAPLPTYIYDEDGSVNPHKNYICTVSLAYDTSLAYVVEFTSKFKFADIADIFAKYVLTNSKIKKIAYNLSFEAKCTFAQGINMDLNVSDPLIVGTRCLQVLDHTQISNAKVPTKGRGLKAVVLKEFGIKMLTFEEVLQANNATTFAECDYSKQETLKYSAEDSIFCLCLHHLYDRQAVAISTQSEKFKTYKEWLDNVECPFQVTIAKMEYDGITWNSAEAEHKRYYAEDKLTEQVNTIKAELQDILAKYADYFTDYEIENFKNISIGKSGKTNSVKKMIEALDLPVAAKSEKTGALSLAADALLDMQFMLEHNLYDLSEERFVLSTVPAIPTTPKEKKALDILNREPLPWVDNSINILKALLNIAKISTLLSSHINGREKFVFGGKIRAHYSAWTETGRLKSSKPNGQNVPRPDNDIFDIRNLYTPSDGNVLILIDQSGFELRLLAWASKDETMLTLFRNNGDMHKRTACTLTGKKPEDITKHERSLAKAGNFGISYGGTEHALRKTLKTLGIRKSLDECLQIVNAVKNTYPGIERFQEEAVKFAQKNGYIETIYGYKRVLPEINSFSSMLSKQAHRQAANTPIQGSAADIMKYTQNKIYNYLYVENSFSNIKLAAQIHDEIILDVPKTTPSIIIKNIVDIMSAKPIPSFPLELIAEPMIATDKWGEKVDLDLKGAGSISIYDLFLKNTSSEK